MKKNICILGGSLLFASCVKKEMTLPTDAPASQSKNTKMTASKASYDYTQPLDQILRDAAANSSGRAQQIIGGVSGTSTVYVKAGIYIGDVNIGGTLNTLCWPEPGICEIIVVADKVRTQTNSATYTGTVEQPIVGITALPTGPVGYIATEVTITEKADAEGHTFVTRQLID